jgi:hypothetical protein
MITEHKNFISGEELRKIIDEKRTNTDSVPEFLADILSKMRLQLNVFLLPKETYLADVTEYLTATKSNLDNLTIIYREKNDTHVEIAFVNVSWEKLVAAIWRAQKLRAFL